MMMADGMTLAIIQALVPMFLRTVIPDKMMSLSPSYQHQNTSSPASHFQMMWPSPMMLLVMNSSLIYWNLTPTNLTITVASLHLLQSDPYMLLHIH